MTREPFETRTEVIEAIGRAMRNRTASTSLLHRLGACNTRLRFKGKTLQQAWDEALSWELRWFLLRVTQHDAAYAQTVEATLRIISDMVDEMYPRGGGKGKQRAHGRAIRAWFYVDGTHKRKALMRRQDAA